MGKNLPRCGAREGGIDQLLEVRDQRLARRHQASAPGETRPNAALPALDEPCVLAAHLAAELEEVVDPLRPDIRGEEVVGKPGRAHGPAREDRVRLAC